MNIYIADISALDTRQFMQPGCELSGADLARLNKINATQTKRQFLIGRVLIYDILKAHNIKKSCLSVMKNGALVLNNTPHYISLAHKDNMIVVALDQDPIGIDIENTAIKRDFVGLGDIMHFGRTRTANTFYKKFTAYEARFKQNSINKNSRNQYAYIKHDKYLICVCATHKTPITIYDAVLKKS